MKNRDKYMKEIYAMIPNKVLINFIGVYKNTNKVFKCSEESHKIKCEKCIFNRVVKSPLGCTAEICDYDAIGKWLNQEAKEDVKD